MSNKGQVSKGNPVLFATVSDNRISDTPSAIRVSEIGGSATQCTNTGQDNTTFGGCRLSDDSSHSDVRETVKLLTDLFGEDAFKDIKTHVWELPLTHDGVFGGGLEEKLKERQEINKQLSDLLPEVDRKRKFPISSATASGAQWKRPHFNLHTGTRTRADNPDNWRGSKFLRTATSASRTWTKIKTGLASSCIFRRLVCTKSSQIKAQAGS
ncbi:hypothetical protein DPMN_000294 [Dreissena polymorpha]|uniref:Uncharacterized protein n=1 Tax=Dreissena polymorpha TaxID=45954 RepID=A0A9D4RPD4_DREPO|nr:hypothetical protein DPMN_000294 [Dreissena polymorpha]